METKTAQSFKFKQFEIHQERCAMKVGTDGVLLGAWADVEKVNAVLDIGAGSGLIAIMLAQRTTESIIHAVEIDRQSYEQAMENINSCPWSGRLEVFHQSIQDYARGTRRSYNLIVSNPPFFSGGTFSASQDRNSVRHTVKLPHGDLLISVRNLLTYDGRFCVILPFIEGLRFQELARNYNLYCNRMTEVRPTADKKVERLLMQFERVDKGIEKAELIIQKEGRNDWTDAYIELTGAFYLNM